MSIRLPQYSVHSNPPCNHSYSSPSVRIISSIVIKVMVVLGGLVFILHGIGSKSTISKSNRMNKIAIKKNWMEMGVRAFPSGSKPHSYGDSLLMSGFIIM